MVFIKKLVLKGFKSFARETSIELSDGMNVIVGPNGSGKSARWDTEVLLASGDKKPIGEIVEESLKKSKTNENIDDGFITKENPLGIKVLSINPETMKIEESEVKAFIKREGEPNLYTIKTSTGKEVTTTSCHPVMIYRNGRVVSEIVENLRQGDFLATPNKIELLEDNKKISFVGINKERANSKEFARFLGYIVGDGCIIKNSRIDFVNADTEILLDYQQMIDYLGFKLSLASREKSIAKNVYLYSKTFANHLINFFNNNYKKEKKHIPKEILFGKKEILKNFLAALFDCDASIRKDNPTFEYVTMSKELANNVIIGLLRFGIVARKTKKLKYASNTKLKNKKEYFFIVVEGKEKISKLYTDIPLKCIHKKELLKKWAENNIIPNPNTDLLPLEVNKEIKEVFNFLGIKLKPLRKKYPFLMAYVENRCNASRKGVSKLIPIIQKKLSVLISQYNNLCLNQSFLVKSMLELNISGQEASRQIGLHPSTIMRDWASNRFQAKTENLENFYKLVKNTLAKRISRIKVILNLLKNLVSSDIFWDEIDKIEKVRGEKYVYDLEIEENHNFIANNIFVHNSNITDAICFVLGRLSVKSMRASKASNLIFVGTKQYKPASEASVKLILDNSDKKIPLSKEIIIERTVRKNRQSLYKINDKVKTRQEILEVLSQAGIDPYGFNIILQGEIDSVVKMHGEERRKIIEEVAGISIYEIRKEKSLKELEKTEERLKEVQTTLRERTSYLKNLEEERRQALRYKKLQETIRESKASIIKRKIDENKKQLDNLTKELEEKEKAKEKQKKQEQEVRDKIENQEEQIQKINTQIQKSSGIQQESLNREISDLRAELAGLNVRLENNQEKLDEFDSRKQRLEDTIKNLTKELETLRKEFPSQKKKQSEIETKKSELEEIEKEKKTYYSLREKLSTIKEKFKDKEISVQKNSNQVSFLLKEIEKIAQNLTFNEKSKAKKELEKLIKSKQETEKELQLLELKTRKQENLVISAKIEISNLEEIKGKVSELDICPLCKSKITEQHIKQVFREADEKISSFRKQLEENQDALKKSSLQIENLKSELESLSNNISKTQLEIIKLDNVEEKKEQLKSLTSEEKTLKQNLEELEKQRQTHQKNLLKFKDIEEKYDKIFLEIQEISSRTEENINVELDSKHRDLEKSKLIIKQLDREKEDTEQETNEIEQDLESRDIELREKEKEADELEGKFRKLINLRQAKEKQIHQHNSDILQIQNKISLLDTDLNNIKIQVAEVKAKKENYDTDFETYKGVKILNLPIYALEDKLEKSQRILDSLGSVNLRALEVYDKIKEEYDKIAEKVIILEKEKEEIFKIIEEIDRKKKRTFMKTLRAINELFNRNFSQLYVKGEAFLELENREDPFAGGLDIIIKVGKGKYFDVNSLSGGERVLVALSLIFAIQEYKPYFFYIFDEVDAALDKRNSERLSALVKKYMKTGQYIIVTHNDAIITESSLLYGVSMQEGISKIISLEV